MVSLPVLGAVPTQSEKFSPVTPQTFVKLVLKVSETVGMVLADALYATTITSPDVTELPKAAVTGLVFPTLPDAD